MSDTTINLADNPLPDIHVYTADKVTFNNNTGASVTITMSNPGLFNPSPGGTIELADNGTSTVTVGNTTGTDNYQVSAGAELGGRGGTIQVN